MVCDNDIFLLYTISLDLVPYSTRISDKISRIINHVRIQGGGAGGPDPLPLKNHKIWVLSNTGPDSLKNRKATKPAFNVEPSLVRQRNAI